MMPLYAARIEDLGPGDRVEIECRCGHALLVTSEMLMRAGAKPIDRVLDLPHRLRCRECDEKGKAVVLVRWGASPAS